MHPCCPLVVTWSKGLNLLSLKHFLHLGDNSPFVLVPLEKSWCETLDYCRDLHEDLDRPVQRGLEMARRDRCLLQTIGPNGTQEGQHGRLRSNVWRELVRQELLPGAELSVPA